MEYKELKRRYQQEIRNKDYKLWHAEDIICQVVELDEDSYGKHEEKQTKNMINEKIDGSCLNVLTANNLHRSGINNFR